MATGITYQRELYQNEDRCADCFNASGTCSQQQQQSNIEDNLIPLVCYVVSGSLSFFSRCVSEVLSSREEMLFSALTQTTRVSRFRYNQLPKWPGGFLEITSERKRGNIFTVDERLQRFSIFEALR